MVGNWGGRLGRPPVQNLFDADVDVEDEVAVQAKVGLVNGKRGHEAHITSVEHRTLGKPGVFGGRCRRPKQAVCRRWAEHIDPRFRNTRLRMAGLPRLAVSEAMRITNCFFLLQSGRFWGWVLLHPLDIGISSIGIISLWNNGRPETGNRKLFHVTLSPGEWGD